MTETYGDWETPASGPTRQSEELARRDDLRRDLNRLYDQVSRLEAEIESGLDLEAHQRALRIRDHLAGLGAGAVGAAVSLLFNVLGALVLRQHPLEIVRVCLTLPLGGGALSIETGPTLAIGVVLYVVAGSFFGLVFHAALSRLFAQAPGIWRLLAVTVMGLGLWVVNFHLILRWLPPLFGQAPQIASLRPAWLAALTHVIYAWTILLVEGRVRPAPPAAAAGDPVVES